MKGNRKLTEEQVHEIRCLNRQRVHYRGLAELYSLDNIANKYGIGRTTVLNLIDGISYQDIPEHWCEDDQAEKS